MNTRGYGPGPADNRMPRARQGEGAPMDEPRRPRKLSQAVASPHLAGMNLEQLRAYRRSLQDEEDRVSYWRRLVHARLDMLEARSQAEGSLTLDQLIRVLGDTGTGASRTALSRIRPEEPLPDLPQSAQMWVTEVDPHDPASVTAATERLREAEVQLTEYRKALFDRIDEATADLISRYKQDPTAALAALPD